MNEVPRVGIFDGVDYRRLEVMTLHNLSKSMNLGAAYGMGPQKLSQQMVDYAESDALPLMKVCEKCGCEIPIVMGTHSRRPCMYGKVLKDQERKGYVPSVGMFRKLLAAADVPVLRAALQNHPEVRTKGQYPPLQEGDYIPVWALLLIRQGGLSTLTSPKRPRVKRVIERLKKARTDVDEQRIILTEHILQQGPYTAACRALIGRLME